MASNITKIKSEKIAQTVYNLCRQANIYIPKDIYNALVLAYVHETESNSKETLKQNLQNFKIAAHLSRPICQDTGMIVVFVEIGQDAVIEGDTIEKAVNAGIEKAYKESAFRKSLVKNPIFERENTDTNTPAVIHTEIVPGNTIKVSLLIKGAGSENHSSFKMLKPAAGIQGIIEFALEVVKNAGAKACPPLVLGIGVGGTMEYSALLAKKALLKQIKTEDELIVSAQTNPFDKLSLEIMKKCNDLKIGAGGFGGNSTVIGVNILDFPTHVASLPVAINISCHALRHASAEISESKIKYDFENFQSKFEHIENNYEGFLSLNTEETDKIRNLKAGTKVLLSGHIYTARDSAHKQIITSLNKKEELPINIKDKIIYYTGPCPSLGSEPVGPTGPTTARRMDKFAQPLYDLGLLATIGKGERSEEVVECLKKNKGIYFTASGGAGCLLSQYVVSANIHAYRELGSEAIFEYHIKDFPLIVAIDAQGNNVFK